MAVLVLGSLAGVVIAFLLSAVAVVRRAARPERALLGEEPGEPGFVSLVNNPAAHAVPGLAIYRFGAPLVFANAQVFEDDVDRLLVESSPPVRWFVLDAEAIADIDSTGSEALERVIAKLRERGVVFAVTRLRQPVRAQLEDYGLLAEIDPGRIFRTNRAAAAAYATHDPTPIASVPGVLANG